MSLAEILVSQPSLTKIITLKGTQKIFLQIFINTFRRLWWTSEYKSYIWYFAVLLVQLICKCQQNKILFLTDIDIWFIQTIGSDTKCCLYVYIHTYIYIYICILYIYIIYLLYILHYIYYIYTNVLYVIYTKNSKLLLSGH